MTEINAAANAAEAQANAQDVDIEMHIEGGACRCGCGDTPAAKRNFRPGHDQRLMGILARAARAGHDLVVFEQPENVYNMTPAEYGRMVLTAQGQIKLERYIATEPKRARKARAASNGAPAVEAPAVDPLPTTVKVGRWEYPVTGVERDGNGAIVGVTYKNKRDEEITTRSWGKLV